MTILVQPVLAQHSDHEMDSPSEEHTKKMPEHQQMLRQLPVTPQDCSEMEVWDIEVGMCMPLPMSGMPMTHLMLHGNAFLVGLTQQGPRGKDVIASPNMFMANLGRSVSDDHFINFGLMLTAEKWTFPRRGYPELLQVGERDTDGNPYVDAQHPHSSPIMGLTLSDTIRLSHEKNHLKLFFSPRGQSTEGPIAFMHRPTGMANPDAPLGHHVGQDVAHITSTVLGGSLKLGKVRIEASTFNGTEPEPTEVDLPIRTPNSGAVRLGYDFSPTFYVLGSLAYIKDPEPHQPDISHQMRHTLSAYFQHRVFDDWMLHHTVIHGAVTNYDRAPLLNSFGYEFFLDGRHPRIWGRFELLERTPTQLQISVADPNEGRWVGAATLGYSHLITTIGSLQLIAGASGTKDFLPEQYIGAYGGNPWSGKVFVQVMGMNMWAW